MSSVTLRAQCLCRAHTFITTVPTTSLPLRGSSCHCTSCRHFSGALRSSDAVWPGPKEDVIAAVGTDTSVVTNNSNPVNGGAIEGKDWEDDGKVKLRRYQHSPRVNVLFCGRCGSGMFFEEWDDKESKEKGGVETASYLVFTGVLSLVEGDLDGKLLVRFEDHMFVGDTVDGGSAPWLRRMNGLDQPEARVWLGRRNKSEEVKPGVQWPAVGDLMAYEVDLKKEAGEKGDVPVRCHCGGVDLVLRAGEAQREFEEMQRRGEGLPLFVDPVTHKFLGNLDGCDSCRTWVASEVVNWTFSLLRHISFAGARGETLPVDTAQLKAAVEAADRDPRLGTLTFYASSPDVQRYFCGRCSASVFYAVDLRPDMVDIAAGLLDSPDGARVESVISWNFEPELGWRQDMAGTWREGMLLAAEKDVEEWRIARGYPKNWRRIAREQAKQAGGK